MRAGSLLGRGRCPGLSTASVLGRPASGAPRAAAQELAQQDEPVGTGAGGCVERGGVLRVAPDRVELDLETQFRADGPDRALIGQVADIRLPDTGKPGSLGRDLLEQLEAFVDQFGAQARRAGEV